MRRISNPKSIVVILLISFIVVITATLNIPNFSLAKNKQANKLPVQISQKDWKKHKKSVKLSTGITMKYVEMGRSNGPTLVLIHGMTDNSRSWSLIAPYLATKYHLYMVDLRGHGDTDKPDLRMYPISMYASDIADFIDKMKINNADIIGHSLGSMVAQELAINYPEKVRKLVLESSALVEFDALGRDLYDAAVGFGNNPPDQEFMDSWYANPNPVNKEFLSYEMKESQNIPPKTWRAITKGAAASYLVPFMNELKAPTLILWGSADSFFGIDIQKKLRAKIPKAKLVNYIGTGHNIQWEIPQKMAHDVMNFLN
ncbi:Pimeloyl-ACP methyl ester carboxylesterase [Seinonella peptonophila]|uniref:Pimeloyl-ACP methyl ester carboxylesterase n=1 Tax=Seinonella peptonophila TaxID=112248 RepID=A0A1M5BKH9_9BACL|nr:alpha/beta hydrolase [Seinonella peptonophila]SHF43054.1 Pimeloyl-ACP methyl ester carboxylesterase [Seinonella peptonophila]